jgi:hypothetical protein
MSWMDCIEDVVIRAMITQSDLRGGHATTTQPHSYINSLNEKTIHLNINVEIGYVPDKAGYSSARMVSTGRGYGQEFAIFVMRIHLASSSKCTSECI